MHCNNGLNNKLVESLVENKVAQETGDLKYLQDSMYDFVSTLKEIILGEYSPEFFNKYVDEALKLHGSNLEEFLKIPKMGLELRQALNSIDEAIDTSNQDFRDNLVLLLDRFQTTLDNIVFEARDAYETALDNGFEGTKQEWLEHLEGDSAYKLATLNGFQGTEQEWLDHLEGDSAYEIAVNNGYVGTQSEWLKYIRADGFIQSIQQFATNNAETQVQIPDYGSIKSLQGFIKDMFENGGLPATPFATKALMTASALVDGDYAQVTDDDANNGLYLKTAGVWVKSAYDPLAQAKSYTDTAKGDAIAYTDNALKENNKEVNYDNSIFNIQYPYNSSGESVSGVFWQNWRRTNKIPVKAGDTIEINAVVNSTSTPWLVLFNASNEFTGVQMFGKTSTDTRTGLYTVEEDGFIVAQDSNQALNSSLTINKGKKIFASGDIETLVTSKADKLEKIYFTDFESGNVNYGGVEMEAPHVARSVLIYKLKAGTKVTLVNTHQTASGQPKYQFGFGVRADDTLSPFTTFIAQSTFTHTITADKPYIRFFFRDSLTVGTELNIEEALSYISIYVEQPVLRENVFEDGGASSESSGLSAIPKSSSAYRPSSMATGGVITIIDDDGKAPLYTELYPFLKDLDVPFGIAVHGGEIGNEAYITKQQLDTMYADKKYIEVLSHGFKHRNLASATPEIAEATVRDNKEWFNKNGYDVDAFVLPNGGDNEFVRAMVARYYNSCYDYGAGARVETFDTINNHLIKRTSFNGLGKTVDYHKTKIDEAVANNGWLIITTHVGNSPNYWGSYEELTEIIEYARTKGMKFKLPREGFQIFGNIAENDSGFRIQANGKIVGAS